MDVAHNATRYTNGDSAFSRYKTEKEAITRAGAWEAWEHNGDRKTVRSGGGGLEGGGGTRQADAATRIGRGSDRGVKGICRK